jgi:hypothetical protein
MKLTDREINEYTAAHVAGWTLLRAAQDKGAFKLEISGWFDEQGRPQVEPAFVYSNEEALQLLDRWRDRPYLYRMAQIDLTSDGWLVKLAQADKNDEFWQGSARTLSKAICVALLRATGHSVSE